MGGCNFIRSTPNDYFSSSEYIVSNDWMIVNNELERIWKEAVVGYCKVLSRYLSFEITCTVDGKVILHR
jgi:hypothetical protein